MTKKVKILAFAGSLRKDSVNKKLVQDAAKGAEEAGAKVTYVDLKEYPLPIYDQDIEQELGGLPENAVKLKELMWEHDGLLIASPEYNSSITPVMKNTIDWISRSAGSDEAPLSCFQGKTAAIMSASPGVLGGLRGLVHLRAILSNIGVLVLPQQQAIPKASGTLDEKELAKIKGLGADLATLIGKL